MTAPSVLVTQHGPQVPPGYLEPALMAAGVDYEVVRLHTGTPVPGVAGWDGIVSLGGAMGAYDDVEYPYLSAEKGWRKIIGCEDLWMLRAALGRHEVQQATGTEG